MELIRGTTPTLIYTFQGVDPGNLVYCYLVVKQGMRIVIEKSIDDAEATADTQESKGNIAFTLSQADTLQLTEGKTATVCLDWKLSNGTRGRSNIASFRVSSSGKNEVI